MPATGKPGGFLSGLPNPAMKKPAAAPVVVSPEAEQALGLAKPETPPIEPAVPRPTAPAPEPERSKTFFLPYGLCERLEMQKLSERREMKHIVRQALEEYFERNPLRRSVRDLYEDA